MEELNRKIPQLPWIVATIGIILAGYFFLSTSKVNTEIIDRQSELDAYQLKLEQFKKLESAYGHGSDRYYANKHLLILKTGGEEDKFTIFWDSEEKKDAKTTMSVPRNSDITSDWASKFNNHTADVVVKSGKSTGCYFLTFSDNVSDDKFQVLVVVK